MREHKQRNLIRYPPSYGSVGLEVSAAVLDVGAMLETMKMNHSGVNLSEPQWE